MKKIVIIVLSVLFAFPAFSQHPPMDKNWEVVFEDDFNSFNTALWYKAHNTIHGNYDYYNPKTRGEEPQVYIQDNAYIENGKLVLRAIEQTYPCPKGSGFLNCQYGGTHNYTSGAITSCSTYKYGYYEIYAKLPASDGYWPAFWLWNDHKTQPSNCWSNEIDVFEAQGNRPSEINSNAHTNFDCSTDNTNPIGSIAHQCNYSTGYHWYGIEWDSKKITWYIDRKSVRQIENNMEGTGIQNPMYITLNVALYPWDGNLVSPNTIFPNYMFVDQANVYKLKYDCYTVINEIPNFNTYNYAVKKSITLSGATTIPANSNISLRASDFIELKNGFEAPLGAELYLDVTPCTDPPIGIVFDTND